MRWCAWGLLGLARAWRSSHEATQFAANEIFKRQVTVKSCDWLQQMGIGRRFFDLQVEGLPDTPDTWVHPDGDSRY